MNKLLIILMLIFILGCTKTEVKSPNVIDLCIDACKSADIDFTFGPCIGNPLIDDWVCDIAHMPRRAIDNLPENQCSAFKEGKASHFVELDENCELIKVH